MSYVPPHLRKIKITNKNIDPTENSFKSAISTNANSNSQVEDPPKPPDLCADELFPTLGQTVNTKESNLDFASSLQNPNLEKKEVVKEVPDGWLLIRKNGEFVYGDKSEDQLEFEDYLDLMEELRLERIRRNILKRHEEYEQFDLMVNGPKYLNSWEITQFIEDQKAEAKLAARNHFGSEGSSDDDDSGNEFN